MSASASPSPIAEPVVCVDPATSVTATPGVNEVTLSWTNPSEGPAPEGVYVQVSGPEGFAKVVALPGPVTEGKVSGLRNGVAYSFKVATATRDGSAAPSATVNATPTTGMEGVVAGLIVEFEPGSEKARGEKNVPGKERVADVDLTVAEKVSDDAVLVEMSEPVDVDTATRIAEDLAQDEEVAWAEPDQFLFTASESTNNDDATSATWNLGGAYGVDAAYVEERENAGEGVTVAVIDTGITNHPDLVASLVEGYDFVSSPEQLAAVRQANAPPVAFDGDYVGTSTFGPIGRDSNPADPGDWRGTSPARDSSWHGTGMAGLINDVAPGAKVQPIRALSWRGGLLSDIAASITWASGGQIDGAPTNANPSKVINMSFAVEATCPTALQDAIDGARDRGAILIAAAGNASDDASKFAPGNCTGVITVASTTEQGTRADYSNYGPAIDISAPGGDTTTPVAVLSNTGTTTPGEPTRAGDFGTSVSASHVAAGAAILASANPSITPDEAYQTLTGRDYTKAFAGPTCDAANPDYSCGTGILTLVQIQTACIPFTYTYDDYTVVKFQGAGTCEWTVPSEVSSVDVLAVGGGGGGGAWVGGGGGGGGVTDTSVTTPSGVMVTTGSQISVTVGAGGSGAIKNSDGSLTDGTDGGTSTFGAPTPVMALGGGVGASFTDQTAGTGSNVATGGGGSEEDGSTGQPGIGQTSDGGAAFTDLQPHPAGGGGGAGGDGNVSTGEDCGVGVGGAGGPGASSSITGAAVYYGGGGGGGVHGVVADLVCGRTSIWGTSGAGGLGGGATGASATSVNDKPTAASGTDGLGGGGGGAATVYTDTYKNTSQGGDGGDGVVVVRYLTNWISISAGDNQSGLPSQALGTDPQVQLTNADGTGVDGVTVTFAVATGGGSVGSASVTTSGGGYASTPWTLGNASATQTLTATATAVGGSPVTFTASTLYTITYDDNGGSGGPGSESATTGSTVTVSSIRPTRAGFTFTGWLSSLGGTVTGGDTFTMPATSVTLTAQWQAQGSGGGQSSDDGTTTPGNDITPVNPIDPPSQVLDGEDLAVVTEGGEPVTVVLRPTKVEDGWEAIGAGFDMVVRTQTPSGAPVPLASDRRLAVPQGGIVQAAGDGYQASSVVRVFLVPRTPQSLTSTRTGVMPRTVTGSIYLGETTVDNAGEFAASFAVPLSVAVGDYVLQINGVSAANAVRSLNMGLLVEPGAAPLQPGKVQRAGFFEGLSADFSAPGKRKLRQIVRGIPDDAQAVQVLVTGVSVGLDDLEANAVLAAKRASSLAKELTRRGITGEFTVNVSTTFTADGAERTAAGKANVLTTRAGKPLSTVTVLFQQPLGT